jgi:hypothetical protein
MENDKHLRYMILIALIVFGLLVLYGWSRGV